MTEDDRDKTGAREAYLLCKDKTRLAMSENDFNSKSCRIKETRNRIGMFYKGLKETII